MCVATGTPLLHHRQGSHRAHHRSLNVHKLEIFKAQPSQSFPIKALRALRACTFVKMNVPKCIRVSPKFFVGRVRIFFSSLFASVETFFFAIPRRRLTCILLRSKGRKLPRALPLLLKFIYLQLVWTKCAPSP